ncbi:MAG TPA: tetratricopeptide repeat protein [Candidatus Omnitrophota bacterium]|nr:tetratricopeptide repeat protein [Candidatus Omnitrophota bacterium]HPB67817.1 tetratricopeptide repeat protein [Candidatus Omnitrophota bacterium]HQO58391.1 tetratricopeptide repeat protein [Candidatus Omnitrophota bacterium]
MAQTGPRQQIFSRAYVVFPLLVALLVFLADADTAYLSRVNYLKSRIDYYLLSFENGKAPFDRQNFIQSARYYELLAGRSNLADIFYAHMGFCRYYLGDLDRAFKAYETALSLQPHIYTYSWDLGMISYTFGDHSRAVQYLQRSLQEIPWTMRLMIDLVRKHNIRLGQEGASRILNRFRIRAQQDEIHAIHILAQSYDRLGQHEQMLQAATLGITRHGANPLLLFDQALALLRMGRYGVAEQIFSVAIAADPLVLGGQGYHYRSLARSHLGETTAAQEDEAQALRLGMTDPEEQEPYPLHTNFDLIYLLYQA